MRNKKKTKRVKGLFSIYDILYIYLYITIISHCDLTKMHNYLRYINDGYPGLSSLCIIVLSGIEEKKENKRYNTLDT